MSLEFDIQGQRGGFRLRASGLLPQRGVTVLFGPSGTGKSTLLAMLAGLQQCTGNIRFADENWQSGRFCLPVWARPLGMLLQQPSLFSHLDVAGNLAYVSKRRGCSAQWDDIIDETRIRPLMHRQVHGLSGGEAQRVALARALIGNPRLLLLDEPLSAVDLPHRESLLSMIAAVARRIPVLYVTHSLDELLMLADQVWWMEAGILQDQGPLDQALSRLDGPLASRSDASTVLSATVAEYDSRDHMQAMDLVSQRLWLPSPTPALAEQEQGRVRLRIAARDVSLCRSVPEQSSILNILPVTVSAVTPVGPGQHLVRLKLEDQRLLARVSSRSLRELAIQPEDHLYAQIKAVALA